MDGKPPGLPPPFTAAGGGAEAFESFVGSELPPPRLSEPKLSGGKSLPPKLDDAFEGPAVLPCGLAGAGGAAVGIGGVVASGFEGPGAFIFNGGAEPLGSVVGKGGTVEGRGAADGAIVGLVGWGAGDLEASSAA